MLISQASNNGDYFGPCRLSAPSLLFSLIVFLTGVFSFSGCSFDPSGIEGQDNNNNVETPVCGDGTISGDEECDDGNLRNGDGCSSNCTVEHGWECFGEPSICNPICGDGMIYGDEECDGDNLGGATCTSLGYDSGTLRCSESCTYDTSGCDGYECGNNVIEPGEVCDGTDLGGQTCATQGFDAGDLECLGDCSGFDTSGCYDYECGNDVIDPGEVCDGTALDGQTCETQGFDNGTLACLADCSGFDTSGCYNYECGNDVIDPGEVCDGTALDGQTCESVDTMYHGGTLGCEADCLAFDTSACEYCGDGIVNGPEVCDGSELGGQTCATQGFDNGTLACLADCSGFDTSGCYNYECGNDVIDPGEVCDGADLGGQTCESVHTMYHGGTLGCEADCLAFDTSACEYCGDGIINGPEVCDGTELDGKTCEDFGYTGGTLGCTDECTFDFSNCSGGVCGDGIIDAGEECDDGNNESGDGCSADCMIEPYFNCEGEPSVCYCVVYVDGLTAITDPTDGMSWATAYPTVQEGIDQASALTGMTGTCEVWVAGGSYLIYETSSDDTVDLASNVTVYGGFNGTEVRRDDRDWTVNETILDGADIWTVDKVEHVLTAYYTEDATMDGFIIKNGHTGGEGAGLWSELSSLHIENCRFTDNVADDGGAVLLDESTAVFHNCTFRDNEATAYAGAIYGLNSQVKVSASRFANNTSGQRGGAVYVTGNQSMVVVVDSMFGSANTSDRGGAIYLDDGDMFISSVRFRDNVGLVQGGALFIEETATIENSIFQSNSSNQGGGILAASNSVVNIVNSLFYGNIAADNGGGIRNARGTCHIANSIFRLNTDQISNQPGGTTTTVRYSNVQGGYGGEGNIDEDPLFVDPLTGNYYLQPGSPCIDAADGDLAPAFDMDGNPRVDDPDTPNTGTGTPDYADIGPYEYQP